MNIIRDVMWRSNSKDQLYIRVIVLNSNFSSFNEFIFWSLLYDHLTLQVWKGFKFFYYELIIINYLLKLINLKELLYLKKRGVVFFVYYSLKNKIRTIILDLNQKTQFYRAHIVLKISILYYYLVSFWKQIF